MGLRHSYTLLAPLYDAIVDAPTRGIRRSSLQRLDTDQPQDVLINGIGTGLDIPYLNPLHRYSGSDITPAMLRRCHSRLQKHKLDMRLVNADSMQLPFTADAFDIVVMHLILAVVPDPQLALDEAVRVLKPGGKLFILDKFIRPGQWAPMRRTLNMLLRHIATRTDVVFEDLLQQCPQIECTRDQPALLGGWFRLIDLQKAQ